MYTTFQLVALSKEWEKTLFEKSALNACCLAQNQHINDMNGPQALIFNSNIKGANFADTVESILFLREAIFTAVQAL